MPYEGEFAQYKPLRRIAESETVKSLLERARVRKKEKTIAALTNIDASSIPPSLWTPDWVLAIDASHHEESIRNGFPGAEISYITVASVLLDMAKVQSLDRFRPVNPIDFRKTEQAESIDGAFPGCNVILDNDSSPQSSLRKALFEVMGKTRVFPNCESLLETYEILLKDKPPKDQSCPYGDICEASNKLYTRGKSVYPCSCKLNLPLYSTDAMRIHEGMNPAGKNGAMFAEIMESLNRLWMIHILRSLEQQGWLSVLSRMAIILDGPLAVFGHPAWLSHAISNELYRLNEKIKAWTGGQDMLLLGIEKTGLFVNHFIDLNTNENGIAGEIPNRHVLLFDDEYIKSNIIFSESAKQYGKDTYFGRKFFYKTQSGALIVASLPFLDKSHHNLKSAQLEQYPRLPDALALLDQLASSRYPNSLTPIISAHAEAAIPLNLGKQVLADIARKLMRED